MEVVREGPAEVGADMSSCKESWAVTAELKERL